MTLWKYLSAEAAFRRRLEHIFKGAPTPAAFRTAQRAIRERRDPAPVQTTDKVEFVATEFGTPFEGGGFETIRRFTR